jgi:hypothetical protein
MRRGARLVLVEPISESRRDATREDQVKAHEIGPEYVVQELHAAGFRVVKLDDAFAVHPQSGQTRWLVVAVPGGEKSITAAADPSPVATTASDDDGWKDPTLRISLVEYG